ncbi:hypothetical protein AB3X94_19935 [Paraburkholderia sp. BR10923]|uniref:DUF7673 family protein n=1 Tax=Paraburkholderia sp. BR10923 TaxID=3236992 RepID=UPI0034CF1E3E
MSRTAKQRSNPHHQTLPPLRKMFADDPGAQAAYRLFELCCSHAGGSTTAIATFLIGLYNSQYASGGDPAWLCIWSDDATFDDVIATMRWIRQNSQYEIHHIFAGDGGDTMLELMRRFGLWPLAAQEG